MAGATVKRSEKLLENIDQSKEQHTPTTADIAPHNEANPSKQTAAVSAAEQKVSVGAGKKTTSLRLMQAVWAAQKKPSLETGPQTDIAAGEDDPTSR
ncbi:hypothetical protein CI15_06310 [Paraburkholderia monticola]|uniref:Uncharacterized protein n=2 Tax=Paraburkholderia monticola TaxID=1399968 RepID=A0A149PXT9_9BURK|nr:hypothetical protein CI15_06310 [Paraburkholderia monticola]